MKTPYGHLTYCSNIHPGVTWEAHFKALREHVPQIRRQLAGDSDFALGLRCAHEAALALERPEHLGVFREWLRENGVYVFTMNGFPYGEFHGTVVKDQVHAPDWTTELRTAYTWRLFRILAGLLPEGFEGGVSTPPLSYRYWWKTEAAYREAMEKATHNILRTVDYLIGIRESTGKILHLDVEPEPDGILDKGRDFFNWYRDVLLPAGTAFLKTTRGYGETRAWEAILTHVQLCYDVCHFAVSYEPAHTIVEELRATGIRVGKIQVSSALRIDLRENGKEKLSALRAFDEPVYLHQVVARLDDGTLKHYRDLPEALDDHKTAPVEWRVHFHVPLFVSSYGLLDSTQGEILDTLALHKQDRISPYLEVETYTWGVLPEALRKPLADSIVRELGWVLDELQKP